MLRLKYFVSFSLMFIFAVMISFQGCQESSIDPEPVGQDTSYSYIRFINSSYNAGSFTDAGGYVDVWINGEKVLTSFDYTAESGPLYNTSQYIKLRSDSSIIVISEMNSTASSIDTIVKFTPTLDSAGKYTLVIPGNKTDRQNLPSGLILKEDTTVVPTTSNIWIRGIQAYNSNGVIPNDTRVDIHIDSDPNFTPNSSTKAATLQFRGVSNYMQYPVGNWTVKITKANDFTTLLSLTINGVGGKIYSVVPSGFSDVGPGAPRIDSYLDN